MSRFSMLIVSAAVSVLFLVACQTIEEVPVAMENPSEAEVTSMPEPGEDLNQMPGVVASPVTASAAMVYENPVLQVQSNAFSPNGDGYRDTLDFYAAVPTTEGFSSWELILLTEGHTEVLKLRGTRLIPGGFSWDGNRFDGSPIADGWYYGRLIVHYESGRFLTASTSPFLLWRTGPQGRITVPAGYFSPDGDGVNDTITVGLEVANIEDIVSYQVTIYNSRNSVFETYSAPGAPPAQFTWDGTNRNGDTVESAEDYRLELQVRDTLGNSSTLNAIIPVDILVYRDGDQLKIRTSAITFLPYSANYVDVTPSERAKNLATLDRLAEVLKKFPGYGIEIQGHAVMIYFNDSARGAVEQRDVLIPLSRSRAEAVRQALIDRGVQASRLSTIGVGGSEPIVPFSDLENRWMNRRVEFILER